MNLLHISRAKFRRLLQLRTALTPKLSTLHPPQQHSSTAPRSKLHPECTFGHAASLEARWRREAEPLKAKPKKHLSPFKRTGLREVWALACRICTQPPISPLCTQKKAKRGLKAFNPFLRATSRAFIDPSIYLSICIYIYIYTYLYIYIHMHMHTRIHTNEYIYRYRHIAFICACTYIYIYMHIHNGIDFALIFVMFSLGKSGSYLGILPPHPNHPEISW